MSTVYHTERGLFVVQCMSTPKQKDDSMVSLYPTEGLQVSDKLNFDLRITLKISPLRGDNE